MKGQQPPRRAPRESELAYSEYAARLEAADKIKRGEQQEQEKPEHKSTKPEVIARFLKQKHGVSKLEDVSLYPSGMEMDVRNQCVVRNRVRVQLEYNGDVPAEGVTLMVRDCSNIKGCSQEEREQMPVSLVSLCCTWYDNTSPHRLSGALNIAETHKAYAKSDREQADLQQSIGALRNASMEFKPHTREEYQQHALHIQHVKDPRIGRINYHYGNPDFMLMTHLIDPARNLRAGLVQIPPEICREAGYELYDEEAAMALHLQHKQSAEEFRKTLITDDDAAAASGGGGGNVSKDKEEEGPTPMDEEEDEEISEAERKASKFLNVRDDQKIRSWIAVPYDHVLTWCFHTTDIQRRSMGLHCKLINTQEAYTNPVTKRPDKRLKPFCWMVPDVEMAAVEQQYVRSWHNKVDVRESLGEIGITIAPPLKQLGTLRGVSIKLRVTMYVIFWKPPGAARVAPKLLSTFPPFTQFVEDPFSELDIGKLKI